MENILEFIHVAEKLKIERRNGHTSQGKQESVADHCWRLSLMVMLLGSLSEHKINIEKALKLAIIHDLAEIITGDSPYFCFIDSKKAQKRKHSNELVAIQSLVKDLPLNMRKDILELWNEFENQESTEAKFVLALDKIEAQIQHNEADSAYWNSYDVKYAPTLLDDYCEFDSFLKKFKVMIQEESNKKINQIKKNRKNN